MQRERVFTRYGPWAAVWIALGSLAFSSRATVRGPEEPEVTAAADAIVASIADERLRELLQEVLERNRELASLAASLRSAQARPAQARSLPDATASLTYYARTPETRVGPLHAMVMLAQQFPWFGKLPLRERAAQLEAVGLQARLEARRLEIVTRARTLYYEVAFLDEHARIIEADRRTLQHYEEIARARYAAGFGLQADIIKLQAEITRDDTRLLEVGRRRARLVAELNALRDRPGTEPLPRVALGEVQEVVVQEGTYARWRDIAFSRRPEEAALDADIAHADTLVGLARKDYRPDVAVGLVYGWVGRRDDAAGRLNPPEDNGQDDVGVTAGINLPLWRTRLAASVRERVERRQAAEEARRSLLATIDGTLQDLAARLPLTWSQLQLLQGVLRMQAEESLRSAEAAYAAGAINALDLLDAERVLFDVRIAAARARADYAVGLAELEAALATPLAALRAEEKP